MFQKTFLKPFFLAQSILWWKIVVYILGKWKNSADENSWTVGRRDSSLSFNSGKSKLRREYDRSYFGNFIKFRFKILTSALAGRYMAYAGGWFLWKPFSFNWPYSENFLNFWPNINSPDHSQTNIKLSYCFEWYSKNFSRQKLVFKNRIL